MRHHPDCTYFTNSAAWAYCDPDLDRFGIADDAGFAIGPEKAEKPSIAIDNKRAVLSWPRRLKIRTASQY
jgi:hypothetical protein